jgi:hypothetical protein
LTGDPRASPSHSLLGDLGSSVADADGLIVSLKLAGYFYVSYVRVECDFRQGDFTKPAEQSACLISISFFDKEALGSGSCMVNGHTFNLLTTALSSRKVSFASLRHLFNGFWFEICAFSTDPIVPQDDAAYLAHGFSIAFFVIH